jgi:hypothetical protein
MDGVTRDRLDLCPQPVDVDVDGPGLDPAFGVPHQIEELTATEGATRVGREDREQEELLGPHVDRPAAATELARDEIELDVKIGRDREGARTRLEHPLDRDSLGGPCLGGSRGGASLGRIRDTERDPGRGARRGTPMPRGSAPGSVPAEVALDSHWPIVAESR